MLEWLATTAISSFLLVLIKDVFASLLKDALEDYVKDFFKQCITDFTGEISDRQKRSLTKAMKEALQEFSGLVHQELKLAELEQSQIEKYNQHLKLFQKNESVLEILGSPFNKDIKVLDTPQLVKSWHQINPSLPDLPENFDWEEIAKNYLKKVQIIRINSDELRKILDSQNLANLNSDIKLDFNLKKHQEGIREQYGNVKLESLDTSGYGYDQLKLWKIFIPQNVRESQEFLPQVHEIPKEYRQRLKESGDLEEDFSSEQLEGLRRRYFEQQIRSVLDLIEDKNYKYLVILGDPGSGKSTLLQYIALKWAEFSPRDLPLYPVPLLIELRTYVRNYDANKCNDFLDFLEKGRGVVCRLPKPELHAKLQNGDAIVMFDGLDEVFDPAKREEVITDIHRFTNDYKNVRVIVTSRVIGYKPQKLRDAEFYHFMLQDLEAEQVEDFIQRWHKLTYQDEAEKVRKRERLKRAIKDSPAIEQLSGNPLLLTMMAILNRHQELPRDRAELYNQASRVLLQQWDMERALVDAKIDPITIDYKDKQAILRRVAFFMQENEAGLAGNLIAEKDLREIISEYLKSIDINDARPMAKALIQQLRTRNFILCFVGAEYYAFVHRTFLEFFCAWSFVWDFKETQSLEIDELINDVLGKHWRDEKWHEVLRLIVGMIDVTFVGDIISYLMDQDGEEEKFANLFLAGNCLFELRSRQSIGNVEEQLLNRLKDLTGYDVGYYYEPDLIDIDSIEIYEKNLALVDEIRTQAVEVVATTWRDNQLTYTWLKQRVVSDENPGVREEAVRQIATGWKNEPGILDLLKQRVISDDSSYVRREAVRQIATGWKKEPGILDLLKQWVISDKSSYVREEAVRQIATGWKKEPGILDLLKQWVVSDENPGVGQEALRQVATGWKKEPGILDLLKQRLISDDSEYVRLEAVRQIATGWKHESGILDLLKQRVVSDENWDVREEAVRQIATGWKHEPGIFELLKQWVVSDEEPEVREEAVRQIATGWKHEPGIFELLKQWVVSDEEPEVRWEAVRQIATGWKHEPGIFELLKQTVVSDDSEDVREEAVRQIATGWKHEPGILDLLKQRLISDDSEYVREEAVRQIATGWKHEPGIFELLKQRVVSDDSEDVRREAVRQIATGWKHEPGIFEFLCHIAVNDTFQREKYWKQNPRQIALKGILEQYPYHPETLPLLQDRAANDPDEQLREWAKKKLQRLENT